MAQNKKLHFKTNVQLKSIIGKDLINDDNIAILELVKNSFDADAKTVTVSYFNLKDNDDLTSQIYSDKTSRLIIQDDGIGMDLESISNKWLNIAYSEKKITKHQHNRRMAGAKGVGRFSCDRLGKYLKLYSKTKNDDSYTQLIIDWEKFEIEDESKEIQSIELDASVLSRKELSDLGIKPFDNGVLLEIIKLRSDWVYPIKNDEGLIINWDIDKFISLKQYLEKLINPSQAFEDDDFGIFIDAQEFLDQNKKLDDNKKFIGQVKNRIFEKLDFKSTSLETETLEEGKEIYTILKDKGKTIFWIKEANPFYPNIKKVRITVYFLNPYSKSFFTKQTGIRSLDYGSIFLFINGFRVPPYGEPGNDWLGLDQRKGQGTRRYLGLRDVVGQIEIQDENNDFQIVTSREGIVKNDNYKALTNNERNNSYFFKTFRRIERYVVEGLNWDSAPSDSNLLDIHNKIVSGDTTEDQLSYNEDEKTKQLRVYSTIHSIIGARPDSVLELYVNESLITQKIEEERVQSEKEFSKLIEDFENKKIDSKTLNKILKSKAAHNSELEKQIKDFEKYTTDGATAKAIIELQSYKKTIEDQTLLISKLSKQLKKLEDDKAKADQQAADARNNATAIKKELLETKTQNLFLQSVKSQDLDEVVSFLHHIGIGAKNIDTELKLFLKKLRKGKEIPKEVLLQKLEGILLENRKVISISKFAAKSNFKLFTSTVRIDLVGYISEYINNILGLVSSQEPRIKVERGVEDVFETSIKPIELNIIIDNLISNSRRAKSKHINIYFNFRENYLHIHFKDDGIGISKEDIEKIFELGYTTTSGSGIGLYHIKKIVKEMGGEISVDSIIGEYTEFIIKIKKKDEIT
ncbi:MAG: ATP-binding protein [Nonlabens sp.]